MFKQFEEFVVANGKFASNYAKSLEPTLQKVGTAYEFESFYRQIHMASVDELKKAKDEVLKEIDDTPLTAKERKERKERAEKEFKEVKSIMVDDYHFAVKIFEKNFKQYLFKDLPDEVRNVAEIIYERAYNEGHANGYTKIEICFDDLVDFVTKILNKK